MTTLEAEILPSSTCTCGCRKAAKKRKTKDPKLGQPPERRSNYSVRRHHVTARPDTGTAAEVFGSREGRTQRDNGCAGAGSRCIVFHRIRTGGGTNNPGSSGSSRAALSPNHHDHHSGLVGDALYFLSTDNRGVSKRRWGLYCRQGKSRHQRRIAGGGGLIARLHFECGGSGFC